MHLPLWLLKLFDHDDKSERNSDGHSARINSPTMIVTLFGKIKKFALQLQEHCSQCNFQRCNTTACENVK